MPVNFVRLRPQNIGKQQFISIPVNIQRFIQGNFTFRFARSSQIHEDLILDAPGRISRQFDVFFDLKRVHCLDQPDRPYGDQILNIDPRAFELSGNVHDQPEIMLDQKISGLLAASHERPHRLLLFFC